MDINLLETDGHYESITQNYDTMWGYSCYTDVTNQYFWSAFVNSDITGVDLKTMTWLDPSTAPNAGKTFNIPTWVKEDAAPGSYSLSGDRDGNIFNAKIGTQRAYTMAYDAKTKKIFATKYDSSDIYVMDATCFSGSECNGTNFWSFNTSSVGSPKIGPLSALHDGRVVGVQRFAGGANPTQVFLLGLVDEANPAAGITITKIKDIPEGDPYMYTDFTGAFLYFPTVREQFHLSENSKYDSKKNAEFTLKWYSSIDDTKWTGLTFFIRCYKSGVSPVPNYVAIDSVPDSEVSFEPAVEMCSGTGIDYVDIKIEAIDNKGQYSKFSKITLLVAPQTQ